MSSQINQKRKMEQALAGTVDVFWCMASKALEETVLPVRIPLFKGLLIIRQCLWFCLTRSQVSRAFEREVVAPRGKTVDVSHFLQIVAMSEAR